MTSPTLLARLNQGLEQLTDSETGKVSEAQRERLIAFVELLDKWNKAYNLTAVRDPMDMIGHHILDSLTVHPHLRGESVADIGTGAGLPGVPLAVLNPQRNFLLVDSNSKKTRFIQQAVAALGLDNVAVWHGRAEHYEAGPGFDTVTCRALASVPRLLELGGHLLTRDGRLVAQKGHVPRDELEALPPGWKADCVAVNVPFLEEKTRHIIVLQNEREPVA